MRRFELYREVDPTGTSGTGTVAQGCEFDDGTCVLRWLTEHRSTAIYSALGDLVEIHGHGGLSRVRFLDHKPPGREPLTLMEVLADGEL